MRLLRLLILILVLLLSACIANEAVKNEGKSDSVEVEKEVVVKEEETASEEEAASDESTEEAEAADTSSMDWAGNWTIDAPEGVYGYLSIYDETEEGFYFHINIATTHVASLEEVYAVKDGNVALSVEDEFGCVLTLTRDGNRIVTEQTSGCTAWHGAAISFESNFIISEKLTIGTDFLELVKQGKLSQNTYALGTDYGTIVQEVGEANKVYMDAGASMRMHDSLTYGIDAISESGPVIALVANNTAPLTPDEIKSIMGEPQSEEISEFDGYYILYYSIDGTYKLFFRMDAETKQLLSVSLGNL